MRQAAKLARLSEGKIKTVALTVDPSDSAIKAIMSEMRPDFIQLHGHESPARIAAIRALSGASIIKAISVRTIKDIEAARLYESCADLILFDAHAAPSSGALPGGNGRAFNWAWLPLAAPRTNFMLSGGLNSDNVRDALAASGATAVDVSSGVETSPGVKTAARIRKFIKAAKSYRPAPAVLTAAQ